MPWLRASCTARGTISCNNSTDTQLPKFPTGRPNYKSQKGKAKDTVSCQVSLLLPVLMQLITQQSFHSKQWVRPGNILLPSGYPKGTVTQRPNSQTEGGTAVNPLPTAKVKQLFGNTDLELLSPSTRPHLSLQDSVHFAYCNRGESPHIFTVFWNSGIYLVSNWINDSLTPFVFGVEMHQGTFLTKF